MALLFSESKALAHLPLFSPSCPFLPLIAELITLSVCAYVDLCFTSLKNVLDCSFLNSIIIHQV